MFVIDCLGVQRLWFVHVRPTFSFLNCALCISAVCRLVFRNAHSTGSCKRQMHFAMVFQYPERLRAFRREVLESMMWRLDFSSSQFAFGTCRCRLRVCLITLRFSFFTLNNWRWSCCVEDFDVGWFCRLNICYVWLIIGSLDKHKWKTTEHVHLEWQLFCQCPLAFCFWYSWLTPVAVESDVFFWYCLDMSKDTRFKAHWVFEFWLI